MPVCKHCGTMTNPTKHKGVGKIVKVTCDKCRRRSCKECNKPISTNSKSGCCRKHAPRKIYKHSSIDPILKEFRQALKQKQGGECE